MTNEDVRAGFEVIKSKFEKLEEIIDTDNRDKSAIQYEAALDVYAAIRDLLNYFEETDENMDPERTNLPNVDEFFKDNPISDYVQAAIGLMNSKSDVAKKQYLEAVDKLVEKHDLQPLFNENLYDDVIAMEERYEAHKNSLLDEIHYCMDQATEYTEKDIALMRYYLKSSSDVRAYDIDVLDDEQVEKMWNLKNFKEGKINF